MEEENIEVPKLENLGNIISLDPEFEEEVFEELPEEKEEKEEKKAE